MIVNLDKGLYFSTDGVGASIWAMIVAGRTADEILLWAKDALDAGDVVAADVAEFLDDLRENELVRDVAETPEAGDLDVPAAPATYEKPALNVYAEQPHAFDQLSKDIGRVFAAHSSVAWNSARRDEQFKRALASRDVIGQAKGMIMERYGVGAVQAFEVLRRLSQDSNVALVQVATELVTKAQDN